MARILNPNYQGEIIERNSNNKSEGLEMNCDRNICYQQDYNGGCETCPCNDENDTVENELFDDKLLPCPFCGGEATFSFDDIHNYNTSLNGKVLFIDGHIECKSCGARTKTQHFLEIELGSDGTCKSDDFYSQRMIEQWNRRVEC